MGRRPRSCGACKPADRRPPWQWCEEHVHVDETSPLPRRWRSDASPWVRTVMEDFANNIEVISYPAVCFVAGMGLPRAFFLDEKLTGPNQRAVNGKAQRRLHHRK